MHKSSAREASANAATGKTTTAAAEIHAWGRGASAGGGCWRRVRRLFGGWWAIFWGRWEWEGGRVLRMDTWTAKLVKMAAATATQPISVARNIKKGRERGMGVVAAEGQSAIHQRARERERTNGWKWAGGRLKHGTHRNAVGKRGPAHNCTGDYVRSGCRVCIAIDQDIPPLALRAHLFLACSLVYQFILRTIRNTENA